MANLLTTVASPLEELVIEYCHEMLNSDAFKAMSKLSNLKVAPPRVILIAVGHKAAQQTFPDCLSW